MGKVIAPGGFGSCLQMNGVSKAKRKTPLELREEQLKRTSFVDQARESFDALRPCRSMETENGIKKQELLKNPKYIEPRMDELYRAKKARPWISSGKENPKENGAKEKSSSMINVSLLSNVAANKRLQLLREENNASTEVSDDIKVKARGTTEGCIPVVFRSVTELSTRGAELSSLPAIDMNKALKGLANSGPSPVHPGDIEKSDTASLSGNFISEFHVPGQKIPLDLSVKTYARLVSSSPINWLHRSIMGSTYNGMPQLKSLSCNVVNQDNSTGSGSAVVSQVLNSMSLHSWVYPQSTLPPFIMSALKASKDGGEVDFLQKRQLAWEDAFRSLYFMFRKNLCKIFYVCTSQFVAMFTGSCESEGVKRSCNAYITQSTSKFRTVLKGLDICYSMPLCKTKIDETTVEDLAELSEIENYNLGQMQTRCLRSASNIDNTPESFLAFDGNESVHGLFDLLLNYRSSSLGFPLTADVPVLYSPVPFQNAAVSSPEIKCAEMVTAEQTSRFIVEIKGEYLPPWIISNICANVGANGQNFEASFVTEPTSGCLNIGLPQVPEKTVPQSRGIEATGETNDDTSGIPGAVICPQLRSGHLKSLTYCDKSYTVSLSPL